MTDTSPFHEPHFEQAQGQPAFWGGGAAAPHPPQLRPISGVATATVALLACWAVVTIAGGLAALSQVDLLRRIARSSAQVTSAEALRNDARLATAGMVRFGLLIATIVLFLIWFSRVYSNATEVARSELRHSNGWAVGSWFVPILQLIRPKQMVDDAWRASGPTIGDHSVPATFAVWWAVGLVAVTGRWIAGMVGSSLDDVEDAIQASQLGAWVTPIEVAAAIAAIVVVRRMTGRQRDRGVEFGQVV